MLTAAAIAVPTFQTQKAKGAALGAVADGEMPTCEPAQGVTVTSSYGTCAPTVVSDAYRSRVLDQCGRSDVSLTQEWWRPDPSTVAFFHRYDDDNDDRIVPGTGTVDCG